MVLIFAKALSLWHKSHSFHIMNIEGRKLSDLHINSALVMCTKLFTGDTSLKNFPPKGILQGCVQEYSVHKFSTISVLSPSRDFSDCDESFGVARTTPSNLDRNNYKAEGRNVTMNNFCPPYTM